MAMAVVWVIMVTASVACGAAGGRMAEVSAAALDGARSAVELCVSLAGVLCLWSGFMELLKQCGGRCWVVCCPMPVGMRRPWQR